MLAAKWYWNAKLLSFWLVAGVLTALPAHAQRTVDVVLNALTRADLCSDRQVVVTIGLSEPLYSSDSLLLFEVAVSYDPQRLQFLAPLFSGTLVEDADYRGSGMIDSATVRIYAFNVMRPLVGMRPLCGLLFRYRQDCPDTTRMWIPYEPEKNAEAKIAYGKLGSVLVEAIEPESPQRSLTVQFPDSLVHAPVGQRLELPLEFKIATGTRLRRWAFTVKTSDSVSLENIRLLENDSLQLVLHSESRNRVEAEVLSPSPVSGRAVMLHVVAQLVALIPGTVTVEITPPSCSCVSSVRGDSLYIVPSVSGHTEQTMQEFFHWTYQNEIWILHGPIEHVEEVVQWDETGRQQYRWARLRGDLLPIRLPALPWSCVMVRLVNGENSYVLLSKWCSLNY